MIVYCWPDVSRAFVLQFHCLCDTFGFSFHSWPNPGPGRGPNLEPQDIRSRLKVPKDGQCVLCVEKLGHRTIGLLPCKSYEAVYHHDGQELSGSAALWCYIQWEWLVRRIRFVLI